MPITPARKLKLRSRNYLQKNDGPPMYDTDRMSSKETETSTRLLAKRSSSSATASSLESDGIVNANVKATIQCKGSKPQRPSSHSAKKLTRKSKVKTKAKSKRSKEQDQTNVAGVVVSQVATPYENVSRDGVDKVVNLFNETLRWNCVCSDSEDEAERLKTYKENRRKRYAEAMQVKVMQRMTATS